MAFPFWLIVFDSFKYLNYSGKFLHFNKLEKPLSLSRATGLLGPLWGHLFKQLCLPEDHSRPWWVV